MKTIKLTVEQVEAVLPQTQCQLCTYDGCKPYAEAIVNDSDRIDRCLPGGVRVLTKLAKLTTQPAEPYIESMQQRQKPQLLAKIREAECIGCTKCIQACPVDAILGAAKLMHTIISDECSGCELCIEPCPVDCIDLIELGSNEAVDEKTAKQKAKQYQERYEFRQQRLSKQQLNQRKKHLHAKQINQTNKKASLEDKQRFIAEALARRQQQRKNSTGNSNE